MQNQLVRQQAGVPLAIVDGEAIPILPANLYIPPDSLRVFLDTFEGPLDLLLYLIKKQNINIEDIPVALITEQYMDYINVMDELELDLVGEYLVMAAMLAEIKSRVLLPSSSAESLEEEDPRAELVRRLQEYEIYKQAAEQIDNLPRCGREILPSVIGVPDRKIKDQQPQVSINTIVTIFAGVLARIDVNQSYRIRREILSVRERMAMILSRLHSDNFTDFNTLLSVEEGRSGVVVVLLAILELLRSSFIEIVQNEVHGTIYLKTVA